MSLLFKGTSIRLNRPAGVGMYVRGRWTPGATSAPITITGTVQPTDGKKLASTEQGKRIHEAIKVFSDSEMFATDPKTKTAGDIIEHDGFLWECIQVVKWKNGIMNNYEGTFIREKEGD